MAELNAEMINQLKDGAVDATNNLGSSLVPFLVHNLPTMLWFALLGGGVWLISKGGVIRIIVGVALILFCLGSGKMP